MELIWFPEVPIELYILVLPVEKYSERSEEADQNTELVWIFELEKNLLVGKLNEVNSFK